MAHKFQGYCALASDEFRNLIERSAASVNGEASKFLPQPAQENGARWWASKNSMLLLAAGVSGWVTISQARFGGQIDAIARQFQGLNTESGPNVQQKL